jgi:hypothetical protein
MVMWLSDLSCSIGTLVTHVAQSKLALKSHCSWTHQHSRQTSRTNDAFQEWMSWTGCMTFTSAHRAYNTLTTISGGHLSTNATVTQQSMPISVKKTPTLTCLRCHVIITVTETWCLSTQSVGTVCSTSGQSSLDASISPGCTMFPLADDTAFVHMDSYLHRWKSSISAASIYEKKNSVASLNELLH